MAKRKRDIDDQQQSQATFILSEPVTGPGPALVSFPAVQAPSATPFQYYVDKRSKISTGDYERKIVVGETSDVEFTTNQEETDRVADSGCQYLIAVYNKRTSTVTVLPKATTPYVLSRTVKALKSIPPAPAPTALEYKLARANLGEAFGTKKAKAAIRAEERNRVDVNAMQGVIEHVMDGIEMGAQHLPTTEEAKEKSDATRLIPPFSAEATDPADVYRLYDIIPKTEWKAIDVDGWDATDEESRRRVLPLPKTKMGWRDHSLQAIAESHQSDKEKRNSLKIIYYISAMIDFRQSMARNRGAIDKVELPAKFEKIPTVIAEGLLSRFTEVARESTKHSSTSTTQTLLLTYLLALCLRVDNYITDSNLIASDLSLPVSRVNTLFRSLGCNIKKVPEKERARAGLSDSYANVKLAVFTAPVKFPKPRSQAGKR